MEVKPEYTMGEIECILCEIKSTFKDNNNPVFPCDSYRRYYCGECSVSNSEIKCIPNQKRTLTSTVWTVEWVSRANWWKKSFWISIKTNKTFENELKSQLLTKLKHIDMIQAV